MRRSASEIIRNLEMRVARLEKQRSANPKSRIAKQDEKVRRLFENAIIGKMNDQKLHQFGANFPNDESVERFMNDAKPYIKDKTLKIQRKGLSVTIKRGINFPEEW